MADIQDKTFDHDYDGIREYDNPLPGWWLWLFYLTIAWALFYVPYYNFTAGTQPSDELAAELADAEARYPKRGPVVVTEAMLADTSMVARGRDVFMKNCMACHAADGGGTVGPNLTDDHWIHGGSLERIAHTIQHGVPSKGMLEWGKILKPAQIAEAAVFVASLKGTKPAVAKAPEGTLEGAAPPAPTSPVVEPPTAPAGMGPAGK